MLKILVASNAFKGSFTPTQACNAIADGIARAIRQGMAIESQIVPLADGGDGTLEAVRAACGGTYHSARVHNAIGNEHKACWLELGEQAFVELASVCGIAELNGNLEPLASHTFGLGEMISLCTQAHKRTVNITLGGSASTDGGMGALAALGARFFDKSGQRITEYGGSNLASIRKVNLSAVNRLLDGTVVNVLTDVRNPLLGTLGAAAVFGPQKGANEQEVAELDAGLKNFADVLETAVGHTYRDVPGSGAAGGTAFGLTCALRANIQSGFDWLIRNAKVTDKIEWSDLVITGEGRFDNQSLHGKAIGEMLKLCQLKRKRLWVVAGQVQIDEQSGIERAIQPTATNEANCSAADIASAVERNLLLV